MQIINFHEHPGMAEENFRKFGIDRAVLLSVGNESQEQSLKMARKEPDKYIPFGWFDKDRPLEEELKRIEKLASHKLIRGLKFQPMDQHMYPDDRRLYPVYELCQSKGLVVTWHSGIVRLPFKYELGVPMLSKYCDPVGFDQVAFDFPKLKICIAHLGGNFMYTALVMAEKHENIYLDTAFLTFFGPRFFPPASPHRMIKHAVEVAGAGKILYGCEGVSPEDIMEADITQAEKEKILGLNALRLLEMD